MENNEEESAKNELFGLVTNEIAKNSSSTVLFEYAEMEFSSNECLLLAAVTAALEQPRYAQIPKKIVPFSVLVLAPDCDFNTAFKVSRSTVMHLVEALKSKPIYRGEDHFSIFRSLCCLLYFLGQKESSYEDMCEVFSFKEKSCFINELVKVSKALVDVGNRVGVRWPSTSELTETTIRFIRKYNFPDVIGILGNGVYHGSSSVGVLFQAVVDDRHLYLDISATEIVNDKPTATEYYLNSSTCTYIGNFVPPDGVVLAAPTYPEKMKNVVTPFEDNGNLSNAEKQFNSLFYACLDIFPQTVQMQRLRFPRLDRLGLLPCQAKEVILASSVLHNACIVHNDLAPY